MRQFEIESLPEWTKIATAVQCPTCFAQVGQNCIEQMGGTPKARVDFHAARKSAAKAVWEQGVTNAVEPSTGDSENVETGGAGLRPSPDPDNPAGVGSEPVVDSPAPPDGTIQGDDSGTAQVVEGEDASGSGDE